MKNTPSPYTMNDVMKESDSHKLALALIDVHNKLIAKMDDINATINTKVGSKGEGPKLREVYQMLKSMVDEKMVSKLISQHIPEFKSRLSKEEMMEVIKPLIPKVELPEVPSKEDIRKMIKGMIPVINENSIAQKIRSTIKNGDPGKDGVIDYDKLSKEIKSKKLLKSEDIDGFEQTMRAWSNQTNRGYLHGAGLTEVIHDTTLAGKGTTDSPLSAVALPGSEWFKETPSGLIDGINTIYTLSFTPTQYSDNLYINGQVYTNGVDYTIVGTTLTLSVALPVDFASLPFVIQYTH